MANRNWDEAAHLRAPDGRFTAGGGARVTSRNRRGGPELTEQRTVPRRPPSSQAPGKPRQVTSAQFEADIPPERRLYRGVTSQAAAEATIDGQLGGGDFGAGIYLGSSIAIAQGYAQRGGRDTGGRVLRGAINPGARVMAPPRAVERRGGSAIAAWAADNNADVIDLGNYQVVRNPAAATFDQRTYTLDESVVLDHLGAGYPLASLAEQYQPIARRLGLA